MHHRDVRKTCLCSIFKSMFHSLFVFGRLSYYILTVFQVFVHGLENINRAIQDDLVAVEILPKSEWVAPSSLILDEKDEDFKDEEQSEKV